VVLLAQQNSSLGKPEPEVLGESDYGERFEHCLVVATSATRSLGLRKNAKSLVIPNR
jgi:hypothetical protein